MEQRKRKRIEDTYSKVTRTVTDAEEVEHTYEGWTYGSQGIFHALNALNSAFPWLEDAPTNDDVDSVDFDYLMHSGKKLLSPLMQRELEISNALYPADTHINENIYEEVARIITANYYEKWAKLWATLNAEYNPLYNYDMTEAMTDDETVREYGKTTTRTPTLTHTKTGSEANSPNVTETETPNVTRTDKVRGFNSTTDVPSGSATSSGTRTTTRTGTDTTWYGITEEDTGSDVHADSGEDTTTRNYALTFSGRVGNFAPADLLIKEWEFRKNEYFRTVIFPDVDKILTLPIY